MAKEYGSFSSFLIGLVVSWLGSPILALIVWIIIRSKVKGGFYWFGALFGLVALLVILLVMFGTAFLMGFWDQIRQGLP